MICMRTSVEKVRISDEVERVQSVSYRHIRSLSGLYIILLSLMPIEETDSTRVRTDCLHFDVSLCIQIKKQISIRGRSHWNCIFCDILDPPAVQDCTKLRDLITNVLLQLVRDIINGVCYQRYEKRLEQQKRHPNANICSSEENMEEEL